MSTPKSEAPPLKDPAAKDDTAISSLRHIQFLRPWAARGRPAPAPHPPISSIPCTPAARLIEPDVSPTPFPSAPVLAKAFQQQQDAATTKPKTVLYLAYGSNMCAQTFLGMRGIRPLSQVNVCAPSLDLTFDLPGRPYSEPCFANTAIRKVPAKPPQLPLPPVTTQDKDGAGADGKTDPVWDHGLYGVVYEVTPEDYAKIVATEGGGAGYHEILVPCFVLPASAHVPEKKPPLPSPPAMPFLAHTLYAPRLPDDHPPSDTTHPANQSKETLPSWLRHLLLHLPHRPSASHAQPSARYLKLLRDGAREHDLPPSYQAYLGALQPYTITTRRQQFGKVFFSVAWLPVILLFVVAMKVFSDSRGRAPRWVVVAVTAVINLIWLSYDVVGRRVFGEGERTEREGEDGGEGEGKGVVVVGGEKGGKRRRSSFASGLRGKEAAADEEKRALLGDCE